MKRLILSLTAISMLSGCVTVKVRKCTPGSQIMIPNGNAGMIVRECEIPIEKESLTTAR